MDIKQNLPDTASPTGYGETPIAAGRRLPPDAALWLLRGERLGDALLWTAKTIAALRKSASMSLRQMSGRISTPPPGEPG